DDRLVDRRLRGRLEAIAVDRDARLQSGNPGRPRQQGDVDRLVRVLVFDVLHRLVVWRSRAASVGDLPHVSQSGGAGWNLPLNGDADAVDRQNAAVVFEPEDEGAAGRGLKPVPVMVGGVVVADRGVES